MPCFKKCFTKQQADKALERIKTGKQYRKEQRAYYCNYHGYWHLTSRPLEEEVENIKLSHFEKWKELLKNKE